MADLRDIRRREDLPPLERALSDALDEYLVRIHGRVSSWASPVELMHFLAAEGLAVVFVDDLRTYVADEAPAFDEYVRAQTRLRAALPVRTDNGS